MHLFNKLIILEKILEDCLLERKSCLRYSFKLLIIRKKRKAYKEFLHKKRYNKKLKFQRLRFKPKLKLIDNSRKPLKISLILSEINKKIRKNFKINSQLKIYYKLINKI
jgi:hypothetical protein